MSNQDIFKIDDIGKLLKEIDSFSGERLKNRIEIQELLEITATNDKYPVFEELIFNAKYVQGLMRVIKNAVDNPEIKNLEQIKEDLSKNIEKVYGLIRELISSLDSELIQKYERNFLEMSGNSFTKLNNLMIDLEWTKMYFNSIKRKV
jgi:predicted  nucleic acid-binding Zn-ribbon protein